MRATIKFDVDVNNVENTMATLVGLEANTLREIADMLDGERGPRTALVEDVNQALHALVSVSNQLQQYRDMLASFRQAKFETVLPQSADRSAFNIDPNHAEHGTIVDSQRSLNTVLQSMEAFDGFVDKMNLPEEEGGDDEEG